MKPNSIVVIDRDWSSYKKGDKFTVIELIPCAEVTSATGEKSTPMNLRVVLDGDPVGDKFFHRTIPAEYAVQMPVVGQSYEVYANQGMRDGTVLAVIGTKFLVEYVMPAGRTFGRIIDVLNNNHRHSLSYRAVCMDNLPLKWRIASR